MSEWLDKLSATHKSIKDQKAAFCISRRQLLSIDVWFCLQGY